MKFRTLICTALLPLFCAVNAPAATNRTTRLGQVDAVADSSFIRLLDAAQMDGAIRLPAPETAGQLVTRSGAEGRLAPSVQRASLLRLHALPRQYLDTARFEVAAIPQSDHFESYLMLGVAAGLIALHLRRKQKSLQQRPLAEVMYR